MATWFELVLSMQICSKNASDSHSSVHRKGPWQKTYSKSDFYFLPSKLKLCKSNGSWEQQHMLIITITIREFNLIAGREEARQGGAHKSSGKRQRKQAPWLGYSWAKGDTWLENCAGFTPDSGRNVAWAECEMLTDTIELRTLLLTAAWRGPGQRPPLILVPSSHPSVDPQTEPAACFSPACPTHSSAPREGFKPPQFPPTLVPSSVRIPSRSLQSKKQVFASRLFCCTIGQLR